SRSLSHWQSHSALVSSPVVIRRVERGILLSSGSLTPTLPTKRIFGCERFFTCATGNRMRQPSSWKGAWTVRCLHSLFTSSCDRRSAMKQGCAQFKMHGIIVASIHGGATTLSFATAFREFWH